MKGNRLDGDGDDDDGDDDNDDDDAVTLSSKVTVSPLTGLLQDRAGKIPC